MSFSVEFDAIHGLDRAKHCNLLREEFRIVKEDQDAAK